MIQYVIYLISAYSPNIIYWDFIVTAFTLHSPPPSSHPTRGLRWQPPCTFSNALSSLHPLILQYSSTLSHTAQLWIGGRQILHPSIFERLSSNRYQWINLPLFGHRI